MDCTETRNRLNPYLDGELDLDAAVAIERHLASCEACQAASGRLSALQSTLRRHAEYHHAPAGLAERVRQRIGSPSARPRAQRARLALPRWLMQALPLGAAAAATALLTWTAALQYAAAPADSRIAEQVVASHARATLTGHGIDVASSDQHTVKPWLSSRLDFSPAAIDLANAGFTLIGGRLDYVADRPVATLVYRYRQHVIDLFVWPEANVRANASPRTFSSKGYHVLRWREAGMAYWAVSDVNAEELKAFAEAYAAGK